jgi:hypothetical protein
MQPAQGSQVPDLRCGQFRGSGEVELLKGDLLLELRPLQATVSRRVISSWQRTWRKSR